MPTRKYLEPFPNQRTRGVRGETPQVKFADYFRSTNANNKLRPVGHNPTWGAQCKRVRDDRSRDPSPATANRMKAERENRHRHKAQRSNEKGDGRSDQRADNQNSF